MDKDIINKDIIEDISKLKMTKEQLADKQNHNKEVASKLIQLFIENHVRISDMYDIYRIAQDTINNKEVTLLYH